MFAKFPRLPNGKIVVCLYLWCNEEKHLATVARMLEINPASIYMMYQRFRDGGWVPGRQINSATDLLQRLGVT